MDLTGFIENARTMGMLLLTDRIQVKYFFMKLFMEEMILLCCKMTFI